MPAGYGHRCESCYWTELLNKRLLINSAGFSQPSMARHFESFGRWLASRVGERKAAITINRYQSFFVEIEREWGDIPSYTDFLHRFGAAQLRRVRLPVTWLSEVIGIVSDPRARCADSERRRIDALMMTLPKGSPAGEVLRAYRDMLDTKLAAGKITLHSIRLALRPAVSLLLAADVSGEALPTQSTLEQYAHQSPGQVSAITGFVNLLNQKYSTGLTLRYVIKRLEVMRRNKLEDKMIAMIQRGESQSPPSREWVSAALEYFHGLPRISQLPDYEDCMVSDGSGSELFIRGTWYWVPLS